VKTKMGRPEMRALIGRDHNAHDHCVANRYGNSDPAFTQFFRIVEIRIRFSESAFHSTIRVAAG
jgi:hypothetical protein